MSAVILIFEAEVSLDMNAHRFILHIVLPPQVKPEHMQQQKEVKEKEGGGDAVEEAEEITYTSYRPKKLVYGKDHPG